MADSRRGGRGPCLLEAALQHGLASSGAVLGVRFVCEIVRLFLGFEDETAGPTLPAPWLWFSGLYDRCVGDSSIGQGFQGASLGLAWN